jgi:hypothetical protein
MTMQRYLPPALVCAAVVFASACGSSTPTTPTAASTSPVTETWTSIVGPGGTASRSFATTQAGTVTVTLTSSDAPLGVGVGVPRNVAGCRLTVAQVDAAGLSVSIPADAGSYCVEVFDDGSVVKQAAFSVQIVHP